MSVRTGVFQANCGVCRVLGFTYPAHKEVGGGVRVCKGCVAGVRLVGIVTGMAAWLVLGWLRGRRGRVCPECRPERNMLPSDYYLMFLVRIPGSRTSRIIRICLCRVVGFCQHVAELIIRSGCLWEQFVVFG